MQTIKQVFSIDDGDSNELATGLNEYNVWRIASNLANRRKENVFVYEWAEQEYIVVKPEEL